MFTFRSIIRKMQQYTKSSFRCNSAEVTYAQALSPNEFTFDAYDMVGFDLDHTLCKYKLRPLFELIYKTLANFLVEKYDYPKLILHLKSEEISFAQKGIILDKARGNFLKLNHKYEITKAAHGTRLLTEDEIIKIYGTKCTWEESTGIPSLLCQDKSLEQPFYVFKDYFVSVGAVLCAKIVDVLDKENKGPLSNYHFWEHFLDGLFYMYERDNFKNNIGDFFPSLKENPHLYLQPCSDKVKQWLRSIGKQRSFLLTSSNVDSATFVAKYCLGENWTDYFNVIITFACKPGFFRKNNPFYTVEDDIEISEVGPHEMKPHVIYSQGNWKDLQTLFSDLCGIKNPKVLYIGDSVVEDVYAPSELAHCDTVAVVEEMLVENAEKEKYHKQCTESLYSDFWGSYFYCNKSLTERKPSLSLWAYLIAQRSKLAVPNIDLLSNLGPHEKVASFSNELPTAGYFPFMPKTLSNL